MGFSSFVSRCLWSCGALQCHGELTASFTDTIFSKWPQTKPGDCTFGLPLGPWNINHISSIEHLVFLYSWSEHRDRTRYTSKSYFTFLLLPFSPNHQKNINSLAAKCSGSAAILSSFLICLPANWPRSGSVHWASFHQLPDATENELDETNEDWVSFRKHFAFLIFKNQCSFIQLFRSEAVNQVEIIIYTFLLMCCGFAVAPNSKMFNKSHVKHRLKALFSAWCRETTQACLIKLLLIWACNSYYTETWTSGAVSLYLIRGGIHIYVHRAPSRSRSPRRPSLSTSVLHEEMENDTIAPDKTNNSTIHIQSRWLMWFSNERIFDFMNVQKCGFYTKGLRLPSDYL